VTVRPAAGERRSPVPRHVRKRESVRRLKEALAQDRLTLLYQPIFRARDRKPTTAEALLRWRRPHEEADDLGGLLAAAERSPVIFALEVWAMRACFREAAAWQRGALPDLRVNLNLSAREFQRGDLPRKVLRELHAAGLDPARLTLEITETSAIHDPAEVARILERLQGEGIQLWLDDFGTGHSSLAWLSWFDTAGLKIPATFVRGVATDRRSAVIAAATLEMAHALGLRVAAEGIEEEAQLAWLVEHGCDELQGFLLAQPAAAAELPKLLGR
jgi:EAL domain-containing protein (putative c-di-GMP-specific phosphodiesterase class I)